MAKKRRTQRQKNRNAPANQQTEQAKLTQEAKQLNADAVKSADEKDLKALEAVKAPDNPTLDDLKSAVQEAQEAKALFDSQTAQLWKQQTELNEKSAALKEKERELSKHEEEWLLKAQESEKEQAALQKKEKILLEDETELKARELNAEAGFSTERRESLARLEQEARVLRDEMSAHRHKLAEECTEFERELEARQNELEQEHQQQTDKLLAEQDKVEELQGKLAQKERQLKWDKEDLEEEKQHVAQRIEQRAAAKLEDLQKERNAVEMRLEQTQKHRQELETQLAENQEASRRIGNRTPEDLFRELEKIRQEREELNRELQTRPDAKALERLQQLTEEKDQWQQQEFTLKQENQTAKRQAAQNLIAVSELETLRDQKKALESNNELLKAALNELRKEVDERIRRADNKSIFPACTDMDVDEKTQEAADTDSNAIDLKKFVEDLQQRIAYGPGAQKELYYSLRDIRSFVAGLAMSRLHLLQGISGTGKTSLPLAAARALGAGHGLVEVQAGWRDRHDLVGHFNAFERRFYESEFLQALYRAQCPQYENRLFFIVLDEMNLSHPEQYFADFLSALEQDPQNRILTLMESAVEPAPHLFIENRKLKIPENIWFIGTANHDETTVDFAPKTYDRAHVMELPRQRQRFDINHQLSPRRPIAWEKLNNAFQAVQEKYATAATDAYDFIEQHGESLDKHFKLGWGNRLQRQMKHYVPVVIAAGGSLGEAADHILASKLLRKLKDRY
ncbi:MAG: hypothetical protein GY862_12190, partial [Gammaproteobacteria bacterium]|nr:hypothetical protein [Gammaproteobacteria bacterium]